MFGKFKKHRKIFIPSLIVILLTGILSYTGCDFAYGLNWYVAGYSGAAVTTSEATALAEFADAIDGITSTYADELYTLSASTVSAAELKNEIDAS